MWSAEDDADVRAGLAHALQPFERVADRLAVGGDAENLAAELAHGADQVIERIPRIDAGKVVVQDLAADALVPQDRLENLDARDAAARR